MSSWENENKLIISNTGGLIRKMDHQLELINRVLGEIAERKTELTTGDSFIGMRAGEERDWEIAPGIKMTFCWCHPGEFIMGSPETEEGRRENENQVHVTLTKGFWMAKTQVTQKQWAAIMGDNPSYYKGDNLPVECVSWNDAQEFLEKLNEKIGNTDGGKMVLPTQAQWEYACRAGELGPYSGGTIDEVAWYADNSKGKTHPVGMKKSNAWGLHDMHGNIWEWCEDWWDGKLQGGVDPSGPASSSYRLSRGGSWYNFACHCRAADRFIRSQLGSLNGLGFRVARSSVP
jgi:formylglycine-generating enzyme required for sulfatase activity